MENTKQKINLRPRRSKKEKILNVARAAIKNGTINELLWDRNQAPALKNENLSHNQPRPAEESATALMADWSKHLASRHQIKHQGEAAFAFHGVQPALSNSASNAKSISTFKSRSQFSIGKSESVASMKSMISNLDSDTYSSYSSSSSSSRSSSSSSSSINSSSDSSSKSSSAESSDDDGVHDDDRYRISNLKGANKPAVEPKKSGQRETVKVSNPADVLSDLFAMSADLERERNVLLTRKAGDDIDAFLKTDVTMKYHDTLEHTAQMKVTSIIDNRRAVILRLKRDAARFKAVCQTTDERVFVSFWESIVDLNSKILESGMYGGGTGVGDTKVTGVSEGDPSSPDTPAGDNVIPSEDEEDVVASFDVLAAVKRILNEKTRGGRGADIDRGNSSDENKKEVDSALGSPRSKMTGKASKFVIPRFVWRHAENGKVVLDRSISISDATASSSSAASYEAVTSSDLTDAPAISSGNNNSEWINDAPGSLDARADTSSSHISSLGDILTPALSTYTRAGAADLDDSNSNTLSPRGLSSTAGIAFDAAGLRQALAFAVEDAIYRPPEVPVMGMTNPSAASPATAAASHVAASGESELPNNPFPKKQKKRVRFTDEEISPSAEVLKSEEASVPEPMESTDVAPTAAVPVTRLSALDLFPTRAVRVDASAAVIAPSRVVMERNQNNKNAKKRALKAAGGRAANPSKVSAHIRAGSASLIITDTITKGEEERRGREEEMRRMKRVSALSIEFSSPATLAPKLDGVVPVPMPAQQDLGRVPPGDFTGQMTENENGTANEASLPAAPRLSYVQFQFGSGSPVALQSLSVPGVSRLPRTAVDTSDIGNENPATELIVVAELTADADNTGLTSASKPVVSHPVEGGAFLTPKSMSFTPDKTGGEDEVPFEDAHDAIYYHQSPRIRPKVSQKVAASTARTADPASFLIVESSKHHEQPSYPSSLPHLLLQRDSGSQKVYLSGGHSYDRKALRRHVKRARKATTVYYHYPIKASGFELHEIVFEAANLCLYALVVRNGVVVRSTAMPLPSVYVTKSQYDDMLTLRSTQTNLGNDGYVGTITCAQWRTISQDISEALDDAIVRMIDLGGQAIMPDPAVSPYGPELFSSSEDEAQQEPLASVNQRENMSVFSSSKYAANSVLLEEELLALASDSHHYSKKFLISTPAIHPHNTSMSSPHPPPHQLLQRFSSQAEQEYSSAEHSARDIASDKISSAVPLHYLVSHLPIKRRSSKDDAAFIFPTPPPLNAKHPPSSFAVGNTYMNRRAIAMNKLIVESTLTGKDVLYSSVHVSDPPTGISSRPLVNNANAKVGRRVALRSRKYAKWESFPWGVDGAADDSSDDEDEESAPSARSLECHAPALDTDDEANTVMTRDSHTLSIDVAEDAAGKDRIPSPVSKIYKLGENPQIAVDASPNKKSGPGSVIRSPRRVQKPSSGESGLVIAVTAKDARGSMTLSPTRRAYLEKKSPRTKKSPPKRSPSKRSSKPHSDSLDDQLNDSSEVESDVEKLLRAKEAERAKLQEYMMSNARAQAAIEQDSMHRRDFNDSDNSDSETPRNCSPIRRGKIISDRESGTSDPTIASSDGDLDIASDEAAHYAIRRNKVEEAIAARAAAEEAARAERKAKAQEYLRSLLGAK